AGAVVVRRGGGGKAEAAPVAAGGGPLGPGGPFPSTPTGRPTPAGHSHGPSAPLALVTPPRPTPAAPGAPGGLALATVMAAEGGQQFGRYRLIERIGEGGMAERYTAVLSGAEGCERQVVIKRLRPHLALNPDAVAQFIDEAKLGSVLAHSNIVTVSDFGKVGDGYFLAAEYVSGHTLAAISARHTEQFGRPLPA